MTKYTTILVWILGFSPLVCIAQTNDYQHSELRTFGMFREPSYITFAGGAGNIERLMFEADIIPYYQVSLSATDRWGIELSPQVILRMYNEYSYPVRTPSFIPRASIYYKFRQSDGIQNDLFGYFSWFHHSNGQEDSFFEADSVTINTRSGNFATNAVEAGFFMSKPDKRIPYIVRYFKLSSVYHYYHIKELDQQMGDWRIYADLQAFIDFSNTLRHLGLLKSNLKTKSSMLTVSTKLGWILSEYNNRKTFDIKRLIIKETISFKPRFLKDVTLFAQYYYGQDYYNIYFNRTLHVFRFGIMAKPGL